MLIGAVFFLICSILIAISNSIESFMIARFFQGMGLCFIGVVGYASIQEMFPEKEAVKLIAWMAIVAVVAPLMGPLLGGIYTQYFNWRGIYGITIVLASVSWFGLWKYMPETAHLKISPDQKLEKTPDLSGLPPLRFKSVLKNYKNLLLDKRFLAGSLSLGLLISPLLSWISISPVLLIEKSKLSPLVYGFVQIPIFLGLILGNLVLQKLTNVMPLERIVVISSGFVIIGLLGPSLAAVAFDNHYMAIVIPLSVYTFGLGLCSAPLNRLVLYHTPIAKGAVSAVISLGNMLLMSGTTAAMPLVYYSQNNMHYSLFLLLFSVLFTWFIFSFAKHKR